MKLIEPISRREYVVLGAEVFEQSKKGQQTEIVDPSFYELPESDDT